MKLAKSIIKLCMKTLKCPLQNLGLSSDDLECSFFWRRFLACRAFSEFQTLWRGHPVYFRCYEPRYRVCLNACCVHTLFAPVRCGHKSVAVYTHIHTKYMYVFLLLNPPGASRLRCALLQDSATNMSVAMWVCLRLNGPRLHALSDPPFCCYFYHCKSFVLIITQSDGPRLLWRRFLAQVHCREA